MEKKGDLLNQLAIVSDLLEKINIDTESKTVIITMSKKDFDEAYLYMEKKYGVRTNKPDSTFNIKIGTVDIIFNTSNA
jgi:hypothetical protein